MLLILILLSAVLPLLMTPGLTFHHDTTPKTILLCALAAAVVSRRREIPAELSAAATVAAFACVLAISDYRLARFRQHPGVAEYEAIVNLPFTPAAEDTYCSRILASSCRVSSAAGSGYDCWRTALHAAARATSSADDTANAWYNMAQFTAAQNDVRGTRMALSGAIAVAPKWFKPHWALAQLLARTGEPAAAQTEASLAVSLDSNHNPRLFATRPKLKTSAE